MQSDQTLCTGCTDESVSVMDGCSFIPRRIFFFATSFSLVMRPAQYPVQLTHYFLFPGNKAIGNEDKTKSLLQVVFFIEPLNTEVITDRCRLYEYMS